MTTGLRASLDAWQQQLHFLVDAFGFSLVLAEVHAGRYRLRWESDVVGVEATYQVRDMAAVRVCRLDAVHGWPRTPGEIGPETPIHCVGLGDVEAVSGRPPTRGTWSIPTEPVIAASASSLRAEQGLLLGDFTALDAAAVLVRARARGAAEAKWGPSEFARRWGDPPPEQSG